MWHSRLTDIVTAAVQITAVAWGQSLAWELPRAVGEAKKTKTKPKNPAKQLAVPFPVNVLTFPFLFQLNRRGK